MTESAPKGACLDPSACGGTGTYYDTLGNNLTLEEAMARGWVVEVEHPKGTPLTFAERGYTQEFEDSIQGEAS